MTSPAPGDRARYAIAGTVRNDATLGLVVDWVDASAGSGTVPLNILPPPTDVQPATLARDAIVQGSGQGPEPPIGSVLVRQSPRAVAYRAPAGWFGDIVASDRHIGPGTWADIPAGAWKIVWLGSGT